MGPSCAAGGRNLSDNSVAYLELHYTAEWTVVDVGAMAE